MPNSIFICKFATAKRRRELANPSFAKLQQNKKFAKLQQNKDKKKSKDEVFGETLTSPGINFVNGKIVATEELDQAILENFGACPSMSYFETNSN